MTVFARLKSLKHAPKTSMRASMRTSMRLATISVVALLGAACAGTPQSVGANSEVPVSSAAPTMPGVTLMGNYLAGLHAQVEGDMHTAGMFLGAALDLDPDNASLTRRTFLVSLSDGNMHEALKLAHRVLKTTPDDQFANLTLAADALKIGNFEDARSRIASGRDGGLYKYFKPLFNAWSYVGKGGKDADGVAALLALKPLADNTATSLLRNSHAALINASIGKNDEAESLYVDIMETQGGMSLRKTLLFGAFYEGIGAWDKAGALYNGYIDQHGSKQYFKTALERVANKSPSSTLR